jgi:hypothetical protein
MREYGVCMAHELMHYRRKDYLCVYAFVIARGLLVSSVALALLYLMR